MGAGQSLSVTQADDGLVSLNDLIEALSLDNLMIYYETLEGFTMTGAASYTMGTGGVFNSARPLKILGGYYSLNSVNYPQFDILNSDQWDSIPQPSNAGSAGVIYIFNNNNYPLTTIYVYPQPTSGTLYLRSQKQLTEFTDLDTSASLPPGYERMLRYCLAQEKLTEYNIVGENAARITAMAQESKAQIKRLNSVPKIADLGLPVYGRQRSNIYLG